MAYSTLRVNRDCLRRALVAQQPGTGQWDTGVPRWKSETPGVSLWLPWHFTTLAVCFVCPLLSGSTFSVFHHTAFSDRRTRVVGHPCTMHLGWPMDGSPPHSVEASPVTSSTGWRRTKSAASCSAFLLLPLTVPHGKWQKV